ncbi:Prefoldin subunit 6 [Spiromyces aspiralis]|uniref:Prefoldin subunit 6 n=1 Tax=Spiromyces aspiralis TaxID=68401 RepID=A0ACC1HKC1_9FUNG|nr:Prefoldin subunit 6 [Spiromyces aspiralis]
MALRKRLEDESYELQKLQKEYTQLVDSRRQLESQLQENQLVDEEFKRLGENTKIYKLTGPVLLPQDKTEAVANVEKRLEFIQGEIKRIEGRLEDLEKQQKGKIEEISRLQAELQKQVTSTSA